MEESATFSIRRVTRFYVPLLLQGFSQSLTYPLVAGIVTHGVFGVNALTAFSQGLLIMFMIGAIGGGLVTTGLVFAKTYFGYASFKRLNGLMAFALLVIQVLVAMPPFDKLIFEGFFGLPPELAGIARRMLLGGVVMNLGFFLRNVPIVVLFNRFESGKANNATFIRIALTLVFAVLLPRIGCVGPDWGLFALTFGVWVETLITWLYARPYVAELPRVSDPVPRSVPAAGISVSSLLLEQFRFTMPLALGGFLLACSPLVIAAFVARSAMATDMLAIHYVTMGVVNPVAFAALRLQTVAVKFLPEYPGDRRLLFYAIAAGLVFGVVPLLFSTATIGNWYFGGYQNVPDRLLPTVRLAAALYAFLCLLFAVRARIEGIAAAEKRSDAVMYGQIAYTAALFLTCAILLPFDVPGWLMAVVAIHMGPIAVTVVIYATRRLVER